MAAMSLGNLSAASFLGICQRRQKQIFLRTQFFQILCQCRNFCGQLPVPEHMNRRERLFLGKQAAALLRLISDVLCQLIVLCEGRAQRIQRSIQAFLALAEISSSTHRRICSKSARANRFSDIFPMLPSFMLEPNKVPRTAPICDLPSPPLPLMTIIRCPLLLGIRQ